MLACAAACGCLVRNADIPGDCGALELHVLPLPAPTPPPPPQSCTLGRPSPERWRRIRVARLNPGIPELLFGSSTSLMLRLEKRGGWWRWGWVGAGGGTFNFIFSPLFPKQHQALSALCYSALPMVSAHRSPRLCPRLLSSIKTGMI